MKKRNNAATAALKPTDKKFTSSSLTAVPSAPKLTTSAPAPVFSAPKPTTSAPAPVSIAPKPASGALTAPFSPPKPTSVAPKSSSGALTTIEVKLDVGFGNSLFLRGEGSGLTWERGVPLACVDGGTWRWSQEVAAPITFKVLLNDEVWSAGSDLVVKPGQKLEVSPCFA